MSGLAGVATDIFPLNGSLRSLGELLSQSQPYTCTDWSAGGLHVLHVQRQGSDPVCRVREDGLTLFMVGRVYNLAELGRVAGSPSGEVQGPQKTAAVLLNMYRSQGTPFVRDLNGEFVLGIWDEREQVL